MFPRINRKRLFVLIISFTFISTCVTFFLSRVTSPVIFAEMKTSLGGVIHTWQNMAYLVDTQPLVAQSVDWLGEPAAWEDDLLAIRSLNDTLKESYGPLSSMVLLNNSLDIRLGNLLVVRIDVHNGYDEAQLRGGDNVRVWVTDDSSQSSLTASVSDLRNGSYLASFQTLFTGIIKIKAAISCSKENLSKIVSSIRQGHVQLNAGLFQKDDQSEVTLCGPFSALPNYTAACDFTPENNNISLFCGQPYNPFLSCQDWKSMRSLPPPKVSSLPARVNQQVVLDKSIYLPNVLSVNVSQGGRSLDLPPCTHRSHPLVKSWLDHSPQGYMKMGKWYPRSCQLLNIDKGVSTSCLTNKTVSILGSSPFQDEVFKVFQKLTGCENKPAHPTTCSLESQGFKITSQPYALPIYSEKDEWTPKSVIAPSMGGILSPGQHIFLIDHSVHNPFLHHSVYRRIVRQTVGEAEHLLEQNDQVFIAVAGPRTHFHNTNLRNDKHDACEDCFAHQFIDILKEEYKRIRKGVLFLDGWDMTSSVNNSFYSLSSVQYEMVKLLLNYVCDFFAVS